MSAVFAYMDESGLFYCSRCFTAEYFSEDELALELGQELMRSDVEPEDRCERCDAFILLVKGAF